MPIFYVVQSSRPGDVPRDDPFFCDTPKAAYHCLINEHFMSYTSMRGGYLASDCITEIRDMLWYDNAWPADRDRIDLPVTRSFDGEDTLWVIHVTREERSWKDVPDLYEFEDEEEDDEDEDEDREPWELPW